MLLSILDLLNKYANLILILITAAYVLLTWGMVQEMKRAREGENTPQLVATLIPFGRMYVKLRIYNTGHGPAINVEAIIRFEPVGDFKPGLWLHPALISGAHEDFRLPGNEFELDKLASKYDNIVVELRWMNVFKHAQNVKYEFDLKRQKDGWANVGLLVQPEDTRIQLGKIHDELSKIRKHFDELENDQRLSELMVEYKREKSLWWRLWQTVTDSAQKLFRK